jgi:putative ABC transport system substrate-binding protein
MRESGFVEGTTVRYELRAGHGASSKLIGLAEELVRASVDLIAVVGAVTARAAREVTRDIPIVYAVVVDPVGDGLAASTGQPLENMSGITTYDPNQARVNVALLRSVKPSLTRIAVLADNSVSACLVQANVLAAQEAGLCASVYLIDGLNPDFVGAFTAMQRQDAEALIVLEHPANGANAARIAELALAYGLPTALARAQAEAGGLFSYGTSLRGAAYEMARYATRILRGSQIGDLPVQTFHCPELVINLRTARYLGLTVPSDVLSRAMHVIE